MTTHREDLLDAISDYAAACALAGRAGVPGHVPWAEVDRVRVMRIEAYGGVLDALEVHDDAIRAEATAAALGVAYTQAEESQEGTVAVFPRQQAEG